MAKDDKLKALDAAIAQIERQYGKGSVMKLGDNSANMNVETVPTGSLSLDIALGLGGLPKGRIIEIYGPESSGKTTVALHCVAEVQKQGGIAGFIDAEHALDPVYAKNLKPSPRGELEITDLNRIYLEDGSLNVELLGQGFTWLDTGTHESLVEATNFVKTIETHQHRKIACLEEIGYLNGWIGKDQLLTDIEPLKKNQYGQYLMDVMNGKYIDK